MASSTSDRLHEEVSNITECGICKDVMRCPKILPCVHTFCLKCLEQYGRNKRPNGVMSCPVCREEFQVPSGGISALPKNFFIENLLEALQPFSEREAIEARRRRFMGDISERLREVAGQKLVLGKYTEEYKEKEKQIEEEILQKGQEMKRLIDGQLQSLIMKLHSETSVRFIEISNLKEELETRTAGLEVLQMQSEKTLSQAADPSDIARMTNDLKQKATEFKERLDVEMSKPFDVSFLPADQTKFSKDGINFVGKITKNQPQFPQHNSQPGSPLTERKPKKKNRPAKKPCGTPTQVASIPFASRSVRGVAVLQNQIFVIITDSNYIQVYDSANQGCERSIQVNGLSNPWDIIASCTDSALFIGECKTKYVHKVRMPDEKSTKWMVNSGYLCLSMTRRGNVLVTCREANKLVEYTSEGRNVREIQLQQGIDRPRHALELSDDQILLCHTSKSEHRVCLISSNGAILTSFGSHFGSRPGQLNDPTHLALLPDGMILVADKNNNRILMLNMQLEVVKDFIPSAGFNRPFRLCLTGSDVLHVPDNDAVRIFSI